MPAVDEGIASVEVKATTPADVFRRYLLWLVVLPLLIYFAGFFVVRIPSYERWGGSAWGPILDYAFQTGGENADVVIFGDSSPLFAVDPLQMSKQLGLKVINLPNTIGGLPVLRDMALRDYLASNRPPKLIVFYFCAWDLDYARAKGTRLFEGEEMLVRHGSWNQIMGFMVHHPREAFYFPFRVYSGFGPRALLHLLHPSSSVAEIARFRGHVANVLPYARLASECQIPESFLQQQATTSVKKLMQQYSTPQTMTLLYLAPVPGCQNVGSLLTSIRTNLAIGAPAVLPPRDFSADGYYAHLEPNAVSATTDLASLALRPYLQRHERENNHQAASGRAALGGAGFPSAASLP